MAWLGRLEQNIAKKNLGEAKQASKQARLKLVPELLVHFPVKEARTVLEIEPKTSNTRSENHATRPNSQLTDANGTETTGLKSLDGGKQKVRCSW